MTTEYHHGVRVVEINNGTRPIKTVSTAIIGMVCTAPDADPDVFPLNKPVLLTNVYDGMGSAGDTGTLAPSLDAIANQTRPVTVVVRVAPGSGQDAAAATTANVIGATTGGNYTGLHALLAAQAQLGVKPRILGVPGLANQAVTTAMAAIAQQLRAMVYAGCDAASSVPTALTYQQNFSQREIMLLYPNFRRFDTVTAGTVDAPATAYALGLRAKIDQEQGWHKTLSNVGVNGVTGLTKDIYWDLQTPGTDADLLNDGKVTTLIRQDGFRFWGSRTCSDEPLFAFESATRTAQVLADTIADAHMWANDKPLLPGLVRDILEGVNAKFRELTRGGYILGGSAWYDDSVNTSDTLKTGRLAIDYDYTPVPPLEDLTFQQRITDRYFADFADRVAAGN